MHLGQRQSFFAELLSFALRVKRELDEALGHAGLKVRALHIRILRGLTALISVKRKGAKSLKGLALQKG
jgi:hypothetical protein